MNVFVNDYLMELFILIDVLKCVSVKIINVILFYYGYVC